MKSVLTLRTPKELLQAKKDCREHCAAYGQGKITKKTVIVGIAATERYQDVLTELRQGCAQYGSSLFVLDGQVQSLDEQCWDAMDVCIILEGSYDEALWRKLCHHGVVPLILQKSEWTSVVEEYEPTEERGNGFMIPALNVWALFATLIRVQETKRFSYDWNTLLKRLIG